MDQIPNDLATAVRIEALAAPGFDGDVTDIYRRARRRRNRHLIAASAGVAVVLALPAVAVALRHPAAPPPAPAGASGDVAAVSAQRLLLAGAAGKYAAQDGTIVSLGGEDLIGELTPDGRLVGHRVVGADGWDRVVGLPDGRIVALGPLRTGDRSKNQQDGPGVSDLDIRLVVTDAGGKQLISRDVRHKGENVGLLAASGTTAYLWRPSGVVAHDLASGTERVWLTRATLGLAKVFDGEVADLRGDRLALSRPSDPCRVSMLTTGGAAAGEVRLAGLRCDAVSSVRLSPRGDLIAVIYQRGDVLRVAVAQVADGRVLVDRNVPGKTGKRDQATADVAWTADRRLMVVSYAVGKPGQINLSPVTIITVG